MMLSPDDAQFLDRLEATPHVQWTDEDTHRLWILSVYRAPPADIRRHYSRDGRGVEIINEIRNDVARRVARRLEQ